ncbi:PA-phosphatase [uncultured Brevundimonas sp.]|uniref:PA-phosphatase n=1 Tax=uncultured Brevundimonas sp. TaxID=213418 RepID=UPI0030ED9913
MTPKSGATLAVAALLLVACANLPETAPVPEVALTGYLPDTISEQLAATMLPGPSDISSQDRAGSEGYRALEGGDRWLMAITHTELRPPYAAQHFDCAIGARMTARPMPALTRLMTRLQIDAVAVGSIARDRSPRLRPAAVDPQRRVCLRLTEAGRTSPSWPSIAAAVGTAYGDLFSNLVPARSDAIQRIGQEIGVSRAVCALDWPSDVSAGQQLGHAVHDAAAATPEFQADLALARIEVAAARAPGLESPGCAAERRLFPAQSR